MTAGVDLPVDRIVALVRDHRAAIITAPPGAGKTTRIPPALVEDGPVLLLQPRRVAARAIARYIAQQQQWTLGREVGWQVRFDRNFSPATRLLFATEGILTARLQDDPLLTSFRTVVIDEFHERSIHADLALALTREAWRARPDLRLVVMSATIDAQRVATYLDDAPVVDVPGRMFPLEVIYRPGAPLEDVVVDAASTAGGSVLCFLPGAPEIRRALERIAPRLPGIPVLPLHGGLDADEQDAAIAPAGGSRVILATNLAETTLTVPDVSCVVDAGTHKVARYDPERAIDSLVLERITMDSADQRAGRAGRVGPGRAIRVWDSRDRLRPHREPEIARVDLASTVLAVLAWGGDPRTLGWFDPPPASAIDGAFDLLRALHAIDAGDRLTARGRAIQRLPLHPRLATLLIEIRGAPEAARACALLSERQFLPPRTAATSCDLLASVERDHGLPSHVTRLAHEIRSSMRAVMDGPLADRVDEMAFRRAVLAAYPDRVAKRRAPRSDRLLLASGAGARLSRDSGVHDAEFIVAVDVSGGVLAGASATNEALVRLATRIEREWIASTHSEIRHEPGTDGEIRAWRVERYRALTLSEHPVAVDPAIAADLLANAYLARSPGERDQQLMHRLSFAGIPAKYEDLVRAAVRAANKLSEIAIEDALTLEQRRALERFAPLSLQLPSGRRARLEYRDDGRAVASVKLQDLFGVVDTPVLGPGRMPVTFELLAPNGRPVQVTNDLRSFWSRGYADVRKELRAWYPNHKWPDDPFALRWGEACLAR